MTDRSFFCHRNLSECSIVRWVEEDRVVAKAICALGFGRDLSFNVSSCFELDLLTVGNSDATDETSCAAVSVSFAELLVDGGKLVRVGGTVKARRQYTWRPIESIDFET